MDLEQTLRNIKLCIRILNVAVVDDTSSDNSSSSSHCDCPSGAGMTLVQDYAECVVRRFIEKEMLALTAVGSQEGGGPPPQQDATQPPPAD